MTNKLQTIQTIQKTYDLEQRTFEFARRINAYVGKLSRTIPNLENAKQLVRSAGSVGANYIEANEALGKKDFLLRLRIARKEARESRYWLSLGEPTGEESNEKDLLTNEATELIKILSSIIEKSK
jgi:four helix bundle protein